MRVFVYEHITGGGCVGTDIIASLAAEGDMMLSAVLEDLSELPDVEVLITRDARLEPVLLPVDVFWVYDDWQSAWQAGLEACDAVLPIAPETDGVLEMLCRQARLSGKKLLNSRAEAVAIAASKLSTLDCLGAMGLPVAPTLRADRVTALGEQPWVVKPDTGVGCIDVRLMNGPADFERFCEQHSDLDNWVVQPYLQGTAASLSLLVASHSVCLLGCNLQRIVQMNDRFSFLGCLVNGIEHESQNLLGLARGIGGAIPGLWGYIGVDLVMTNQGPIILEINPRLTTSYVGLTRSLGQNVAAMLLQLECNGYCLPDTIMNDNCIHVEVEMSRVA